MSWHNVRSGSTAFALLLCVGGASLLARSFIRLRPIVPIGAVFILSIGYSMILFVAFSASSARRFPSRPPRRRDPRRHLRRGPGRDHRTAHDRGARPPDRAGAGRLVNTYLDGRPVDARRLSRFLVFGLIVVLGVSTLTARMFYLQVTNGTQYSALSTRQRTVLEPILATRGLIYDRNGRALVSNVPTFAVKVRPADLPNELRDYVVTRLARSDRHRPGRHPRGDRQQPGLGLRPRPRRAGRRRGHGAPHLRGGRRPAGRRGRDRGAARVRRWAADVADPRLHRAGLGRAAAATSSPTGYLPDDLIGKAGVERDLRGRAPRHVRRGERRA